MKSISKTNIKKLTKQYLPDILIVLGVLIFSYNFLRPVTKVCKKWFVHCSSLSKINNYHTGYKVLGLVLITLGIIVAVRRFYEFKNKQM